MTGNRAGSASEEWRADAACAERGSPPPRAFDDDAAPSLRREAVMTCLLCPVRAECFAEAAATACGPVHARATGVWGGALFVGGVPVDQGRRTAA